MSSAQNKKIIPHEKVNLEKEKKPTSRLTLIDCNQDKKDLENFKKLISEKIKDPKMAKKAALLIAEMLQKK